MAIVTMLCAGVAAAECPPVPRPGGQWSSATDGPFQGLNLSWGQGGLMLRLNIDHHGFMSLRSQRHLQRYGELTAAELTELRALLERPQLAGEVRATKGGPFGVSYDIAGHWDTKGSCAAGPECAALLAKIRAAVRTHLPRRGFGPAPHAFHSFSWATGSWGNSVRLQLCADGTLTLTRTEEAADKPTEVTKQLAAAEVAAVAAKVATAEVLEAFRDAPECAVILDAGEVVAVELTDEVASRAVLACPGAAWEKLRAVARDLARKHFPDAKIDITVGASYNAGKPPASSEREPADAIYQ